MIGTPVTSVDQLNKLIRKGELEYYIALNGGLRSSKQIQIIQEKPERRYCVYHEIDESEEEFTEAELLQSHVGVAMKQNALFRYVFDEAAAKEELKKYM